MSATGIHIGMGGWDLPPFEGLFYPSRPKKGFRKLEYYSQFFDTVEVNATFYNSGMGGVNAHRWLQDVGQNVRFVFTVKLFQGFTHTFNATREDLRSIYALLDVLQCAGKLGGVIVQFPYSFVNTADRRSYLMQLSKVFHAYRMFVEVRHNSWNSPLMYNFFQENKLHLVNTDLPQIKRHMPLNALAWSGAAYFRMMGRNAANWYNPELGDRHHYLYGMEELESLATLLRDAGTLSSSTFVVFHNDPQAQSLVNGFQLRHLLRQKRRVLVPDTLIRAFPQLKGISSAVNIAHPLFAEV